LTIRIHIMRHHHVAVKLCPSNEVWPRDLHGIIPLQEAPPRGLRGITSWPWGTTTILAWNYVLMLRHHRGLPLRGSMGLRPTDEVPPRDLTTRVMELRPTHTLYMFHPPNQEVPITLISCINNKSYNSCFPIHTQ